MPRKQGKAEAVKASWDEMAEPNRNDGEPVKNVRSREGTGADLQETSGKVLEGELAEVTGGEGAETDLEESKPVRRKQAAAKSEAKLAR